MMTRAVGSTAFRRTVVSALSTIPPVCRVDANFPGRLNSVDSHPFGGPPVVRFIHGDWIRTSHPSLRNHHFGLCPSQCAPQVLAQE